MEDYTIIQGQTVLEVLFALLLTLVTSCVYLSCKAYARRMSAAHAKPVVGCRSMLCPMSLSEHHNSSSPRVLWEKHKSSIADWLAPLVVWSAVIWTLLAVVSILLGEN